jgi:hypothetical protein
LKVIEAAATNWFSRAFIDYRIFVLQLKDKNHPRFIQIISYYPESNIGKLSQKFSQKNKFSQKINKVKE